MRCVAGAGLLALVGCNQVFGITPTKEYDAAPDVVADMPYAKLTWQVATVTTAGDPNPMIVDAPIVPAPRIRHAALLDDHFTNTMYSPTDGSVVVPLEYFAPATTWRLEYTLPDGVPHEVQWSPGDRQGHLTVPIFGQLQHSAVPMGSGYITAPGGATSYQQPRMFTTGLWTEGLIRNYSTADGAKIDYDFSNAVAMSGSNGSPDAGQGDRALLIDFMTSGSCRIAVGSAAFVPPMLMPNQHIMMMSSNWDAGTKKVSSDFISVDLDLFDRLTTALDKLHGAVTGTLSFGVAASTSMPGLPGVPPSSLLPTVTLLPTPVMLTLLQCSFTVATIPNMLPDTAQPASLDRFSRLLHIQLVDTRQVLGISLYSGMETAIASTTSTGFKVVFPAAIPTKMTLTTPANETIDLAGPTEQVPVKVTNGMFTLAFTPEPGLDPADYYDVTLHRLDNGTLTTDRVYTVTAPQVQIDGALLAPQTVYVLEIRSFKGHPSAQQGDFRPVTYPYGSAIVFTRTFKTS